VGASNRGFGDLYSFAILLNSGRGDPADARSLARLHLRELNKRLEAVLEGGAAMNDTTKAHFQESRDLITKVLSAEIESTVN